MQVEQLHTGSAVLMEGPLLITPQMLSDAQGFSTRAGTSAALIRRWASPSPFTRTIIPAPTFAEALSAGEVFA